jgi:hypothetical protein
MLPAVRRTGIVLAGLLVVAVATVLAVVRPWERTGSEDTFAPGVRDALALEVREIMEQGAGRAVVTLSTVTVLCAVRPLGADPQGATRVEEVRVAYVWAFCWVVDGGTKSTGASLPVAVHFGPPVDVEQPVDGSGYTASVRRMFPDRLYDVAFDNNRYAAELAPKVDARIKEAFPE